MVEIHLPPPPKIHGRGIDYPELNVKFHERTETDETHVYSLGCQHYLSRIRTWPGPYFNGYLTLIRDIIIVGPEPATTEKTK
jgi:hypothetical protein